MKPTESVGKTYIVGYHIIYLVGEHLINPNAAGRDPPTPQKTKVSIRGQHKTPAHSDPSSRAGKQHETIIGYTFPGRHPIYEGAICPDCGAAIRWLPLGAHGNLVPRCENERCVAAMRTKTPSPQKRVDTEGIRMRRWKKFGKDCSRR